MKRLFLTCALVLTVLSTALASEPNVTVSGTGTVPTTTSAYGPSLIAKLKGGSLYNLTTNYHTAAYRTLMVFDGTAVPSNGSTTACTAATPHSTGCLLWCFEGDASSTAATESNSVHTFGVLGLPFTNGLVVVASVSTSGCTSLTADGSNEYYVASIDTN